MASLHSSRNSAVYQMRLAECVLTEMSYTFFKSKYRRHHRRRRHRRHHHHLSIDMSFLYPYIHLEMEDTFN